MLVSSVRAAEPSPAAAPSPDIDSVAPAGLLADADAAISAGNLALARSLFERLASEFPTAPEATEARRALAIIVLRTSPAGHGATPALAPTAATASPVPVSENGDIIVREEPYSLKTSERLRLTIWEKVDFSVTAFLYGMSVGLSFALSQDANSSSAVLTPVALGAVVYTLGSVGFLKLAQPDRADLPLALAITSYVPTTTLLVLSAVKPDADASTTGAATAAAGLVSIPVAVMAARLFDLDPGDTQLVRDAGFWGLTLASIGTLGFGASTTDTAYGTHYDPPSGRKVAVAGLAGLYGGLGLGLLSANLSEVSLERVRVTTWGGYGGGVVGLLLGAAANDSREQNIYRGATIGALAGLVITFLSTSALDGIPDESPRRQAWHRRLSPMVVHTTGRDGRPHLGLGVGGMLF
jgi:hypothetical protein